MVFGPNRTRVAELCTLAALLLLGALVFYPVASAGFVLVDDHEILSFTPQALSDPALMPPPSLLDRIFVADPANGRVRPLYYAIRYAEIAVLGPHPQAWHVLYAGLGVLSSGLLYITLRQMGITRLTALMAAAWLIVAPGLSEVWIRLGPTESLGTLLLLVALWAMTHGLRPGAHAGWNWLFVVSASAATLVKESFALVPPALFALRLLLLFVLRGRSAVTLRTALWPAGVPFVVGVAVVAAAYVTVQLSTADSYAGRYLAQEVAGATWRNLAILALLGGVTFPLFAIGMLVGILRRRRITSADQVWCGGAVVACLLIIPQLALYQHNPGFVIGRYILPAGLGLAIGFAAGANWLRARRQRLLFVVVAEVWIAILCFGALETWFAAEAFRSDSVALARLIEAIARSSPQGATIAIAADPVQNFEVAVSLPYRLAASGRPDLQARLLLTPSGDPRAASMAPQLLNAFFAGSADLSERGCSDLAAVVEFSDMDPAQLLPCLTTAHFHLESFSETTSLDDSMPLVVRQIFPAITVSYSALLH